MISQISTKKRSVHGASSRRTVRSLDGVFDATPLQMNLPERSGILLLVMRIVVAYD